MRRKKEIAGCAIYQRIDPHASGEHSIGALPTAERFGIGHDAMRRLVAEFAHEPRFVATPANRIVNRDGIKCAKLQREHDERADEDKEGAISGKLTINWARKHLSSATSLRYGKLDTAPGTDCLPN